MTEKRFRDDFDRETVSVAWRAPDGSRFLVSGTGSGYALRAPGGWEPDDEVDFEADARGRVFHHGESVGWILPAEILERIG